MLITGVALLFLVAQTIGDESLCKRECHRNNRADDDRCWSNDCEHPNGDNCCYREGHIWVDLRKCDLESLSADAFLKDAVLGANNVTATIQNLCLDDNPKFGPNGLSYNTFRGLTQLKLLTVPSTFDTCPGGDKYWQKKSNGTSDLLCCEDLIPTCNANASETCPDKSHCVDDGPGLMRCKCNDGYYGYKCLKTGQFPYAIFYGSLGAATVVLSGVLWFTGRRKIGLHSKQS